MVWCHPTGCTARAGRTKKFFGLILARLRSQSGIARVLRALRDEEGVACEQARFSRLYRAAVDRGTPA